MMTYKILPVLAFCATDAANVLGGLVKFDVAKEERGADISEAGKLGVFEHEWDDNLAASNSQVISMTSGVIGVSFKCPSDGQASLGLQYTKYGEYDGPFTPNQGSLQSEYAIRCNADYQEVTEMDFKDINGGGWWTGDNFNELYYDTEIKYCAYLDAKEDLFTIRLKDATTIEYLRGNTVIYTSKKAVTGDLHLVGFPYPDEWITDITFVTGVVDREAEGEYTGCPNWSLEAITCSDYGKTTCKDAAKNGFDCKMASTGSGKKKKCTGSGEKMPEDPCKKTRAKFQKAQKKLDACKAKHDL